MALSELERAAEAAASRRQSTLTDAQRKRGGVVHTPALLARAMARSADELLRERLGCAGGLADPRVTLVDPACGPGAFVAAALTLAGGRTTKPANVLALDVDEDVVGVAGSLLAPAAQQSDWPLTLRRVDTLRQEDLLDEISRDCDVVAVLGNPPWVGASRAHPSPYMQRLLEDFRVDAHGERLQERKLGVLADTYVRFLRWSLELLARRPGVLAFVTNGSYLDGPVHRAMRAHMERHLDAIDIHDLGGNALLSRGTGRDDNVFGVRTSVALTLASVREPSERHAARIRYRRWRGAAADKLMALQSTDSVPEPMEPRPPLRPFVPVPPVDARYASWPGLHELMPFHREGIQSNRDGVVVALSREGLLDRLRRFAAGERQQDLARAWQKSAHYDPSEARRAVGQVLEQDPVGLLGQAARPLAYRPLDSRWFAPVVPLCHRPRPRLLAATDHSSSQLVSARKDRGAAPWFHISATTVALDACHLSTRSSCRSRAFPSHDPAGAPNLAPEVLDDFCSGLGTAPEVQEVMDYALAVLSAPSYRGRFDDALHRDYPRLPPPESGSRFRGIRSLGETLRRLLTAPLDASGPDLDGCAGHTLADFTLGEDGLYLEGHRRLPFSAGLQQCRVGHIKVLPSYLEARRGLAFTAPLQRELRALVDRLEGLNRHWRDLDAAVELLF